MKPRLAKRLTDAWRACQAITHFVAHKTFADYEADLILRSAVERQFEIVGEALHQAEMLDPDIHNDLPEIRRIVGLRNRIIHGYDSVDDELVWLITQNHIPALAQRLQALLDNPAD